MARYLCHVSRICIPQSLDDRAIQADLRSRPPARIVFFNTISRLEPTELTLTDGGAIGREASRCSPHVELSFRPTHRI